MLVCPVCCSLADQGLLFRIHACLLSTSTVFPLLTIHIRCTSFLQTRDFPPKIQAKGEVEWVCAQQARIRRIGEPTGWLLPKVR